jgi:EmrB/QacA subfamily drug resistance transporter
VKIEPRLRNVCLLVAGCFFMEYFDATIVITSTPKIGAALHIRPAAVGLVITSYLVTLAVLIPLSGWLAARLGARPVFLAAITIFTLASIGCAASTSLGMLVAMRVLQGVGGAMMVPVGRFLVLASIDKSQLIGVMAFLAWPGLAAPVISPLAGGLITTYANWHWLFLINAPLGVIAFVAAWRLIHSQPGPPPPRLDRLGVVLTGGGLAGLTYTADLLSRPSTPWAQAGAIAAASAALLVASIAHLRRVPAPLINLRTLRIPTFAASLGGSAVYWIVVGAVPFLLPLLFQTVFRWSPVKSGGVVLFLFVGNMGIKFTTTFLLNRLGFRRVLFAATTGVFATTLACGFIAAGTPAAVIVALAVAAGALRSIGLTCYATMAFSDMPPAQMRDANTLMATNQQLAGGMGIAAAAVLLRVGGPLSGALPGHGGPHAPFTVAFLLLALIALIPMAWAWRLHPTAGDSVRQAAGTAPAQQQGAPAAG